MVVIINVLYVVILIFLFLLLLLLLKRLIGLIQVYFILWLPPILHRLRLVHFLVAWGAIAPAPRASHPPFYPLDTSLDFATLAQARIGY